MIFYIIVHYSENAATVYEYYVPTTHDPKHNSLSLIPDKEDKTKKINCQTTSTKH